MGIQVAVGEQRCVGLQECSLLVCVLSVDKGTVQKVIVLPRDDLQTEELVLEEVEVFKVSFFLSLFIIPLQLNFICPPLHSHICPLFCLPFCHNIRLVSLLWLRQCTHLFSSYQGPCSDYNNEDLIQKSKHFCATDFHDFHPHREKKPK